MKTKEEILVRLRPPVKEDGADVWELVRRSGTLDLNSSYAYIMLCDVFRQTCAVAEAGGRIVGFVSAFIHPSKPDTLFVWQIAVDSSQRRKGLGQRLLQEVWQREACRKVKYIEATVGPDNVASRSLFSKFGRAREADCRLTQGYSASIFPAAPGGKAHEDELLLRVGPFPARAAHV
ncbi:diaminobutyrate acetyltransferase [Paenibacillus sp. YYML68]|uniref:diaminobutyrate acetyltransferase n=1 Tax=Paenibacillus sp. YYML68 TaxID=2909250 RepID=UPI002492C566|nr:diaminobutyrate acetyltransferase [Paenibacillus sp. YYML68]